eukprot:6578809-Alexandrium_andersonii.AAC.1
MHRDTDAQDARGPATDAYDLGIRDRRLYSVCSSLSLQFAHWVAGTSGQSCRDKNTVAAVAFARHMPKGKN